MIEVNEGYPSQKMKIEKMLKESNYILKQKEQSEISKQGKSASQTFNYIYFRKWFIYLNSKFMLKNIKITLFNLFDI